MPFNISYGEYSGEKYPGIQGVSRNTAEKNILEYRLFQGIQQGKYPLRFRKYKLVKDITMDMLSSWVKHQLLNLHTNWSLSMQYFCTMLQENHLDFNYPQVLSD